jgi:hypothetical protein
MMANGSRSVANSLRRVWLVSVSRPRSSDTKRRFPSRRRSAAQLGPDRKIHRDLRIPRAIELLKILGRWVSPTSVASKPMYTTKASSIR